jgi:hypothetical protein
MFFLLGELAIWSALSTGWKSLSPGRVISKEMEKDVAKEGPYRETYMCVAGDVSLKWMVPVSFVLYKMLT